MKATAIYLPETYEKIASALGKPLADLACDIYAVATHCEDTGNRGVGEGQLKLLQLPVYFLVEDAQIAHDGILFHNSDKEWHGWMCRKNPYWGLVWFQRYGKLDDPRVKELAKSWQEKVDAAAEAAKPKRKSEEFEQGRWAGFTTDEIGLRMNVALLMRDQMIASRSLERQTGLTISNWHMDMTAYASHVWRDAMHRCREELEYRAATGDVDAKLALEDGPQRYFTNEQLNAEGVNPLTLAPTMPLPFVPKVVHVKHGDWMNCPEDERLYIGRNMQGYKDAGWGNPHKVAKLGRLEAIALNEAELLADAEKLARLGELRGKYRVFGCWCKSADRYYKHWVDEDQPCHGDTYVRLLSLPVEEFEKLIAKARGDDE